VKCIIPLAGPDIYTDTYGLKPAFQIAGSSLIANAINSRSWYGKLLFEEDLIFVIRNFEKLGELQNLLQSNFPEGKQIIIPELTKGALLTTLAGASLIKDFSEPIIVDLVDILFDSDFNPESIFNENKNIAGIIPYFFSDNHKYSYLDLDGNSKILRTKEKEVISTHASAGVYFFKNLKFLLKAFTYSINSFSEVAYNDLLFLCPAFNGIINNDDIVMAVKVQNIEPYSNVFKS